MGQDCVCRAWVDGVEASGKALLESEELIFRGPPRRVVRFVDLTSVVDDDGRLSLETANTTLILELGAQTPKWA